MVDNSFFETQTPQSRIKANIVSKCFAAWANVMKINKQRFPSLTKIAYIDLFAGKGRYQDGSLSTPLLVLQNAISDPTMAKMLVCYFNDKDHTNCKELQSSIDNLPGINTLEEKPHVFNGEIDNSIVKYFANKPLIPTFFFLDPWGYKGLSLSLIQSFLKDWGTDGVFFFSYNIIRRGINNKSVASHMTALFGEERLSRLRSRVKQCTPQECERTICDELNQALIEFGAKYTMFFRFKHPKRNRTSHYLVFVTKEFLGYTIMKDIMAKEGLSLKDIPLFYFDSDAVGCQEFHQIPLLPLPDLIESLSTELLQLFSGQIANRKQIIEDHTKHKQHIYQISEHFVVGPPFLKRHYTEAILRLVKQDKLELLDKPKRKNSLNDTIRIKFPHARI